MKCTLLVLETSGSQPSCAHSAYGTAVFINLLSFTH
jgi:hypothetical protein